MICPACAKAGTKSKVYEDGPGLMTAVYYEPFYDEDGRYHHHDGNVSRQNYRCSNEHRFRVRRRVGCTRGDCNDPGLNEVTE